MKRTRQTPEQIVRKLREAEAMLAAGRSVGQVVQALGVSEQTFNRWRSQYGGMKAEEARRLKELEVENARLKKAVADLTLDCQTLQGGERLPGNAASPARRRCVVTHVRAQLDQSERRVCRVLGQARSTQRYRSSPRDDEAALVKRMHELVRRRPRRGYRMICGMLRLEGWRVNRERAHRLWRREGFKVAGKRRKKRRLGSSANGIARRRAEHKDHVWCVDFIHDRDERGRPLKWLSVVDEFTRECPALEVERSIPAAGVVEVPVELFMIRGVPRHIGELRHDMPKLSAKTLTARLRRLEHDGVLTRAVLHTSPPTVEYKLSPLGGRLLPAIESIVEVGHALMKTRAAENRRRRSPGDAGSAPGRGRVPETGRGRAPRRRGERGADDSN